jgi:aerobic-type carbon monoxide dehydrogenase small subunit (CoxS/CutS family)
VTAFGRAGLSLVVDGRVVEVPDDGGSLLDVLREQLGLRTLKDGCSPQGQCGCCTVLVDGQPRVACVTPARRVHQRSITTLDGLDPTERRAWGDAFCATGGSQCGFCTPGIVMRLSALRAKGTAGDDLAAVEQALLAHLCRCTGWRTILDAWSAFETPPGPEATSAASPWPGSAAGAMAAGRDLGAAARRAAIEGRSTQRVDPEVPLGHGGFADDTAPAGALVALPDGSGGWAVGESLVEARAAAGKVQGRRTTAKIRHPLDVAPGDWDLTLRTTWVEPAYLEVDASWCVPGGEPASPLANGGAFGGKVASVVGGAARELADRHGRPVRVLLAREDAVRLGAKRPPLAAGLRGDGTGVVRVARTPGIAGAIAAVAPGLAIEELDVTGPPTSMAPRATGWAEALVLLAGARLVAQPAASAAATSAPPGVGDLRPGRQTRAQVLDVAGGEACARVGVRSPDGAATRALVVLGAAPRVHVSVACGDPLDEIVLRSYCTGAAHMALGWVCSEGLAVDEAGEVQDLTIRSFGVLRAVDTPPIEVDIVPDGAPVNGSDAVFVAVAAATWLAQGCPPAWPTGQRPRA